MEKKYRRIKRKIKPYKIINNYYNVYNSKEAWHMNKEEFRLVWSIICFVFIFLLCKLSGNLWPTIILLFWIVVMSEK